MPSSCRCCTRELFQRFQHATPKGFLLYGPPGCGKTLIGKATAYNLTQQLKHADAAQEMREYFMHIKGPEILNMWVGESERMVREIFATAREKRREGYLPFLFIDEAESILGTRRASRYSNILSTLVPMFCTEMDGIESLSRSGHHPRLEPRRSDRPRHPAPRPHRPENQGQPARPARAPARFTASISRPNLPYDPALVGEAGGVPAAIDQLVETHDRPGQFAHRDENRFLSITLRSGKKEMLYRGDLISGAIIASIVERAKGLAIKRAIASQQEEGISESDLRVSLRGRVPRERHLPAERHHRGLAAAHRLRQRKRSEGHPLPRRRREGAAAKRDRVAGAPFRLRPRPFLAPMSRMKRTPLLLVLGAAAFSFISTRAQEAKPGAPAPAPPGAPAAPSGPTPPPVKPDTTPAAQLNPAPEQEPPRIVPVPSFAAPEGLEVTVWATTPMLFNPTNIDFDKDGRLYVAEGVNYRSHSNRRREGDRIVVLEDTDRDGKADKTHTFVQDPELIAPLGVAVFDNKVVVSQPPDLLVYTDVDRNGKFDAATDTREVLLTGFNGRNHDHSLHSVTAGPDGQWYFNQGNTGALFTDKSGKTFRCGSPYVHANGKQVVDPSTIAGQKSDDGHVWIGGFSARMNPDGTGVAIIGHNYRNSFEQAITSLGDIFQSDNDDPPACRVSHVLEGGNAGFASRDGKRSWAADRRPGQPTPVAEWRQEDPGTMPAGDVYGGGSPTGVAFYENGALGEKWPGLLLACEAGRNVIFGYLPKPDGAGFKLERFDFLTSNKEKEYAGSDFLGGAKSVTSEMKTLFRPSDVTVGPDGALYVADWFDPRVGGHSDLDPTTAGTIYRIAPKGFKSVVPKFDLSTTEGQITALKSPAVNVRHAGFTALKAQGEPAIGAVAELLKDPNPYIAARAIWLLAQMGAPGLAQVTPLLASRDEQVRLVAFRALRRADRQVLELAKRMAATPPPPSAARSRSACAMCPSKKAATPCWRSRASSTAATAPTSRRSASAAKARSARSTRSSPRPPPPRPRSGSRPCRGSPGGSARPMPCRT